MNTNKTKNYSIQDAFKSLDMIEDEAVLNIEETAPVRKILAEKVAVEQPVVVAEVETIDNDEIDAEIEKLTENLRKLKEKYDKDSKSLTQNELKQLKEAGILDCDNSESIVTEEQKINITDKKQVEQELADMHKEEKEDDVEMVVDVEAETVDELKDSYIDNYILQCPVCHTLIYKAEEDVIYSDEDDEIVNVEDACPHCKSEDGFTVIGKVAPVADEQSDDEQDEEDGSEKSDEKKDDAVSDDTDDKKEVESDDSEEEKTDEPKKSEDDDSKNEDFSRKSFSIDLEDLNEDLFNRLATKYLNNIYENVIDYKTEACSVDDENNKITLDGTINFNSGKKAKTTFVFEAVSQTKKGKIRFVGMNESLSQSKKTFTLIGRVIEKVLLSESLTYNYAVKVNEELQRIYGRVAEDLSKYKKE